MPKEKPRVVDEDLQEPKPAKVVINEELDEVIVEVFGFTYTYIGFNNF